jgi:hypothetical protein
MRTKLFLALFGLLLAMPVFAHTSTWYDIRFGVSNGPVLFDSYPDVVLVPQTRVYVVDYDGPYRVYRYGPDWYACRDDHWYRARSYRARFHPVSYRYVPRSVRYVPAFHGRYLRYADYRGYRGDGYRPHRAHRDYDRRWDGYRGYHQGNHRSAWDVSSGKHGRKHKHDHDEDD